MLPRAAGSRKPHAPAGGRMSLPPRLPTQAGERVGPQATAPRAGGRVQEACRAWSGGCSGLEVLVGGESRRASRSASRAARSAPSVDVLTGRASVRTWVARGLRMPPVTQARGQDAAPSPPGQGRPRLNRGSPTRVCPAGHSGARAVTPGPRCERCCQEAGGGLSCDPGLGGPHRRARDAGQRPSMGQPDGRKEHGVVSGRASTGSFQGGDCLLDIRTLHVA